MYILFTCGPKRQERVQLDLGQSRAGGLSLLMDLATHYEADSSNEL